MVKHNSEHCLHCDKFLEPNEDIFSMPHMGCEEYICEPCHNKKWER